MSKFLTLEGAASKKVHPILAGLLDDDSLARGRRLRVRVPTPARIRRAVTPPKAVKKVARYVGAAHAMILTGGFASGKVNKAFGLSNSEQKAFNIASKITRAGTIAAASVIGGGAIMGSMSKTAGGTLSKMLALPSFKGALGGGGKFLMKDALKGEVWSLAKNAAGQLVGSKFNKSQFTPEDYADLPNNIPLPAPAASSAGLPGGGGGGASSGGGFNPQEDDSQIEPEMAPSVAGSTSFMPGGDTPDGYKAGEATTDPRSQRENSAVNPLGSYAGVNPLLDDSDSARSEFDDADIHADAQAPEAPEPDAPGTDDELSCEFDRALAEVRGNFKRRVNNERAPRTGLRSLFA